MPVEIELKLTLPLKHSNRLLRLPFLQSLHTLRSSTQNLYTIYYDTSDFYLKNKGIALRLRRVGKDWIQTIKGHGRILAGLFQHREWEVSVNSAKPDYTKITDPCFQKLFDDPALIEQIQPRFFTQFTRNIRVLQLDDGSEIEFCLDRGKILTKNLTLPICEIELELKLGNASQLFLFALALQKVSPFPLKLENASKAERGYRLSSGKIKPPMKATDAILNKEMSANVAFKTVFCNCLEHLSSNENGMLIEDNIEYLREMWIALGRLRFALKLYSKTFSADAVTSLRRDLKWLSKKFNPAIDWDIFVINALQEIQGAYPNHAGVKRLLKTSKEIGCLHLETARRSVKSKRYVSIMLKLGAWLSDDHLTRSSAVEQTSVKFNGAIEKFASKLLTEQHQKINNYGKTLTGLKVSELQLLRKMIKKQCYATELFANLYPNNKISQYLNSLYKLRDIIEALKGDAVIKKLLNEVNISQNEQVKNEAIGVLLGWTMHRSFQKKLALNHSWISFNKIHLF